MTIPEFKEFSKIPRLSRPCVVTEKIDGTNGVIFVPEDVNDPIVPGSRTRWLLNGDDNHGFARWVYEHQNELRTGLGPGTHFGEWWGLGIQRGYGQDRKRFSLFNTSRWSEKRPDCCDVVPIIFDGPFVTGYIDAALEELQENGSRAAPGFMQPEGIVIFHVAGNLMFKKTLLKDDEWKGKTSKWWREPRQRWRG